MKRVPYTQKTKKLLQDNGFRVDICERWIMGANIRKDLFGIIDLIAIGPGQIIGVQSTSYGCRKDHVNKIYGDKLEETLAWLESKADLLLVCWKKVPKGRSFRYEPVIERITPDGPMEMRFQSTHK